MHVSIWLAPRLKGFDRALQILFERWSKIVLLTTPVTTYEMSRKVAQVLRESLQSLLHFSRAHLPPASEAQATANPKKPASLTGGDKLDTHNRVGNPASEGGVAMGWPAESPASGPSAAVDLRSRRGSEGGTSVELPARKPAFEEESVIIKAANQDPELPIDVNVVEHKSEADVGPIVSLPAEQPDSAVTAMGRQAEYPAHEVPAARNLTAEAPTALLGTFADSPAPFAKPLMLLMAPVSDHDSGGKEVRKGLRHDTGLTNCSAVTPPPSHHHTHIKLHLPTHAYTKVYLQHCNSCYCIHYP
jgi:hypothetical protein